MLNTAVYTRFQRDAIDIPFPQREITIKSATASVAEMVVHEIDVIGRRRMIH